VHGLDVFPLVCPVGEGGGAARDVAEQPLPFAVHDAHMLGQLFHLHQVEGGLQSLKIWDGFGSGFKRLTFRLFDKETHQIFWICTGSKHINIRIRKWIPRTDIQSDGTGFCLGSKS
jgi:hypothetical protein